MRYCSKVCLSFKTKTVISINHIDCFYDHIVIVYELICTAYSTLAVNRALKLKAADENMQKQELMFIRLKRNITGTINRAAFPLLHGTDATHTETVHPLFLRHLLLSRVK